MGVENMENEKPYNWTKKRYLQNNSDIKIVFQSFIITAAKHI